MGKEIGKKNFLGFIDETGISSPHSEQRFFALGL